MINNLYIKDLFSKRCFSKDAPVKEDILKSDKFNIVLVFLESGQEIEPHPEPYSVFFLVIDGYGIFTDRDGNY